jgi:hypothetical protein
MTRKEKLAIMSEMGRLGGKRRMQTLTSQRRREIARKAGLARWAKTSSNAAGHSGFSAELGWLSQHREEYLGQWVALDGGRLVASGSSAKQVYLAARRAGVTVPFVEQVQPPDDLPFGGW